MDAERIKKIRKNKGITLKVLAQATGYTESYLSQMERGLKNPSLEALRRISKALEVPIITFLVDTYNREDAEKNTYFVIEKDNRKKVHMPTVLSHQEMITPVFGELGMGQKFQGFIIRMNKNETASEKQISHPADESILVVKGRLSVHIGEETLELREGDSLYVKGGTLHNYCNEYEETAEIIIYMSAEY